jgi:acyl carrier protein
VASIFFQGLRAKTGRIGYAACRGIPSSACHFAAGKGRSMQTADRVRHLLQKVMVIDGARLTDDARLVEDLEATSLDRIEIIMALEDEFSIEISQKVAESIKTVGDVGRFVESKTG